MGVLGRETMKMRKLSRKSKLGVMVLLFAFLLVPVFSTSGIAQEKAASSAGGFGAAHASGAETTLAASPATAPPTTIDNSTLVMIMAGVVCLAFLVTFAAGA